MKLKSAPPHEPSAAEIQHVAYHLWIEHGLPAGREAEFWLTAETLLRRRHNRADRTRRRRAAISSPPSSAAAPA